jgi:hypothetical protein
MGSELYGGQDPGALGPPDDETAEQRLARHKAEFLATMRELLPPEDLRDIAAAARQARREDFPEDFDE